ncbi:sigma factor [Brevibacillus reuszeri]|nr:sigma factor [Brevibacillus reuszeri]MED1860331.1 sigma factor [Brevibacillus reuszeri]
MDAQTVYKYLFSLTQNTDLSEELTQETFYQAMKTIHNFRGDCKISVWLCQISKRAWPCSDAPQAIQMKSEKTLLKEVRWNERKSHCGFAQNGNSGPDHLFWHSDSCCTLLPRL